VTSDSYAEVRIETESPLVDELAGVLSLMGFEGFWVDGRILKCYMRSERWDPALLDEIRKRTNLLIHPTPDTFPAMSVQTIPAEDWNAQWESTLKPLRVSNRITIAPSWNPSPPAPDTIDLTIDPKMSFGTGYHESTRLILRLAEEYVRPGSTFLDVGTGTGVLAIAAIRLGAHSAVAVDIDPWSFENALENIRLNGVETSVTVMRGSVHDVPESKFDIVAANIQRSVIEPALPELLRRLTEDREPITTSLQQQGLIPRRELCENEWIAVAASR